MVPCILGGGTVHKLLFVFPCVFESTNLVTWLAGLAGL